MLRIILIPLIAVSALSCRSEGENKKLDRIVGDLSNVADRAKDAISRIAPDPERVSSMTSEEIEKLYTVEYKVFDLENSLSAEEIESMFNTLGRDRWDCFHVLSLPDGSFRAFCQRMAKTYLRYLPRVF